MELLEEESLLLYAGKIQGGHVELLKVVVLLFDHAHYDDFFIFFFAESILEILAFLRCVLIKYSFVLS